MRMDIDEARRQQATLAVDEARRLRWRVTDGRDDAVVDRDRTFESWLSRAIDDDDVFDN